MIKLIWKGPEPPTENKEKYLWDNNGVLRYWNGSDWVATSQEEGKIDTSMLPSEVVTTNNLETLVRDIVHDGEDGKTLYTWIKYADDDQGSGMSDFPSVSGLIKKFMGVAYNKITPEKSNDPSDYYWSRIVGSDGQDGDDGQHGVDGSPGMTIRTTVWEPNKQYYDGTEEIESTRYLDIVTDKEMGTDDPNDENCVHYYMCTQSHVSSNERTYEDTEFWTLIEDTGKPIKTPLVLAQKIKADFIDVDDLSADEAFIENLEVKHLDGADGTFNGIVEITNPYRDEDYIELSSGRINIHSEYNTELDENYSEDIRIDPDANPQSIEDPLIQIRCSVPDKPAIDIQNGFVKYPLKTIYTGTDLHVTSEMIIFVIFNSSSTSATNIYLPETRYWERGRRLTIYKLQKEYSTEPTICSSDGDSLLKIFIPQTGTITSSSEFDWPDSSFIKAECYCMEDENDDLRWHIIYS